MTVLARTWLRLGRRRFAQWMLAYAAGAWAVLQVLGLIADSYEWPRAVMRVAVELAVVGGALALVRAWYHGARGDQRTGRREVMLLAVIALLGVGAVGWGEAGRESGSAPVPSQATTPTGPVPDKSVAVLPFVNLSPNKDNEFFSDGVSEEILNALANVRDLKVAGRTASFYYKGRKTPLHVIGAELGVAHVLEGSVRRHGNRVRITAQLVRTSDGFQLWSEGYEGALEDVFVLQEGIARNITSALQVVLSGDQTSALVKVGTRSAEAYAYYLQATDIYLRRDGEQFPKAIAALNEALRLDPKFARAHSRLAAVHAVSINYRRVDFKHALDTARHEANLALQLDPKLAEAHGVLALTYHYRRDFIAAREAMDRAIATDPRDAGVQQWRGNCLLANGYLIQGKASLDRALQLDPLLPVASAWRGRWYVRDGDDRKARLLSEQAVAGGLAQGELALAMIAHKSGHTADARAYFSRGARGFVSDMPPGAAEVIARGVFGDESERIRAVAFVESYLAGKPKTISGGAPWALLHLREPARALAVARAAPTSSDAIFFDELWSPAHADARKLPQFGKFLRDTGNAALWDRFGAPDLCRKQADGEYACG
jgi:TolB-like protein/Tfp pilus assembly protein PilF